jgi:hypothetical protein
MEQRNLALRRYTFRSESLESAFSGGPWINSGGVGISHRAFASIFGLGVVLATTAACSLDTSPKATLTKQIFLEQHDESVANATAGVPRAIAPLPGGDVVLAGSTLSAWASRIRADGTVAWRYIDPRDDSFSRPNQSQSTFTGAVGLSDGSLVLCGSRDSAEGQQGLLLRIGPTGDIVSRELVSPGTGAPFGQSGFATCMPWSDGIVVMGVVPQSPSALGWMIRLGPTGQHLWEKVGQDQLSSNAITLADQTIVLGDSVTHPPVPPDIKSTFSVELKAMNLDGVVTHRRSFPCVGACGYLTLFQNLGNNTDFNLEVLDPPNATKIYHLGADLADREPPVRSDLIVAKRAYRLKTGTLLVFGAGSNAATVASIDARGNPHSLYASQPVWDNLHRSITEESINFDDVAAISATEFLSVRSWNAPREHRGVYVEWFQIE